MLMNLFALLFSYLFLSTPTSSSLGRFWSDVKLFSRSDEVPIDPFTWNLLKSRNLSYLLDKRTIRLVSGANLILSAPEDQWIRVFGQLDISTEAEHNLCETVVSLSGFCIGLYFYFY